jgi:hypothetical protein
VKPAADRKVRHAELGGCAPDRDQLAVGVRCWRGGDAGAESSALDSRARESQSLAGAAALLVEDRSDLVVGVVLSEPADQLDRALGQRSDATQRTVTAVDLDGGDCSVVRAGANSSTTVSVRGRAASVFEVRSAASGIAVVERRQLDGALDDEDDLQTCPGCDGTGLDSDGLRCAICNGTGMVNPDDWDDEADDGRSARAKYSAAELQSTLKKGHALANSNG